MNGFSTHSDKWIDFQKHIFELLKSTEAISDLERSVTAKK